MLLRAPRTLRQTVGFTCVLMLAASMGACSRDPRADLPPPRLDVEPRRKAALGDRDAAFDLGVMFANGQGVPEDDVEAASWYRQAAERGHPGAQNALGFLYYQGQGVPGDRVEAYKWIDLACARTPGEDTPYAVWREYIARGMTAAQIEEGQARARAWSTAFARKNDR